MTDATYVAWSRPAKRCSSPTVSHEEKNTMSRTFPTFQSTNDAQRYLHLFLVLLNDGRRAGLTISLSPNSNRDRKKKSEIRIKKYKLRKG